MSPSSWWISAAFIEGISSTIPTFFPRATVTAFAGHYAALLRALVASPETRVSQSPLLSPAEQHQILDGMERHGAGLPAECVPSRIDCGTG